MRTFALILSAFVLAGCASSAIPNYLQAKHPYTKRFYVSFDEAVAATTKAIDELGWKVESTSDPSVYEQPRDAEFADGQRLLIFSEIRQTPMFIGTRYAKLNIYIKSRKDLSEIEIRYLTVSSIGFSNFKSYRNNSQVDRIYEKIAENLK